MDNINKYINKDVEFDIKKEYVKAKKDETFKKIIDSLPLNDETLMKYTSKIEDSTSEYKNCLECKSLAMCKNKIEGYCLLPHVEDSGLIFTYKPCKYMKKYNKDNKYKDKITLFDIPKEIANAKISDIYTNDKNRLEAIKWLTNFVKNYNKDQKGLFLHGNFGSGKTYLISAAFNELAKKDIRSVIIYYPEFLRSLKASFNASEPDEFENRFNLIKRTPLLLIDDLGAEAVTSWNRDEILGTLLQYRMQENLTTFITSNLNIDELQIHLANSNNKVEGLKAKRIIERIKQLTIDMEMISKNNRV
ncbi:MAG TPA: primosomal protein DnaI [Bacilli bacterium]|nr:primosomal protein DnaI [Bacilli bacterium]